MLRSALENCHGCCQCFQQLGLRWNVVVFPKDSNIKYEHLLTLSSASSLLSANLSVAATLLHGHSRSLISKKKKKKDIAKMQWNLPFLTLFNFNLSTNSKSCVSVWQQCIRRLRGKKEDSKNSSSVSDHGGCGEATCGEGKDCGGCRALLTTSDFPFARHHHTNPNQIQENLCFVASASDGIPVGTQPAKDFFCSHLWTGTRVVFAKYLESVLVGPF